MSLTQQVIKQRELISLQALECARYI